MVVSLIVPIICLPDIGMRLDWNQMDARKYYYKRDWVARGYDLVYPNLSRLIQKY